ncbi:unnamed protein product [Plutella xylostella]|uniref:(diamondback moth) hypothetical protein n=1 Tax=Plutella xylostella TaxID=51655 RepID=A0A8S4FZ64_PLUXY|nr:unnamed protein product [Plutella xylostella]
MSVGTVYDTAYRGDFNQVKVKLDENVELVKTADPNGRLLIHWAALGGNHHLVEYLVEQGSANVNHKTARGQSALQYACSKGHKEVANILIQSDADINHKDVLGATPLHRAAAQGRTNIVELLLSCPNIVVDPVDCTGSTPLHLACEEDREAVVILLLKSGANVDVLNKEKKSPVDLCSVKLRNTIGNFMH